MSFAFVKAIINVRYYTNICNNNNIVHHFYSDRIISKMAEGISLNKGQNSKARNTMNNLLSW